MTHEKRAVVVYTAIFGEHDDHLPTIVMTPGNAGIRYVAFTDSRLSPTAPWEIIKVDSYFVDSKLGALFFKSNPHLFFERDCVAVWIDANLTNIHIDRDMALRWVERVPIAAMRHRERDSALSEAAIVANWQLDDPVKLERFVARLGEEGAPAHAGLSATGLLARDLAQPKSRLVGQSWWQMILDGSRRDQISFDHACWTHGIRPNEIEADWRVPNAVFTRRPHGNAAIRAVPPQGIASEAIHYASLKLPWMPTEFPTTSYFPERISHMEASTLRDINREVMRSGTNASGNYAFFHRAQLNEYVPLDPRRAWKREFLRRSAVGMRNIMEVGFGAGHSAALLLAQSDTSRLHAIDICEFPYAIRSAELFRRLFATRFEFSRGDSVELLPRLDCDEFDLVHLDGSMDESVFSSDVEWCLAGTRAGRRVLVDDAYVPHVAARLAQLSRDGKLTELAPNFTSSGENRLFRIR